MPNLPENLREILRGFEKKATAISQAQDQIQNAVGEAANRDSSVWVKVAPSGAVIDLKLGKKAMARTNLQLQQEILETIQAASADAAEQLKETLGPALGDELSRFEEGLKGTHTNRYGPDFLPEDDTR